LAIDPSSPKENIEIWTQSLSHFDAFRKRDRFASRMLPEESGVRPLESKGRVQTTL
jgi:hypothetical protein